MVRDPGDHVMRTRAYRRLLSGGLSILVLALAMAFLEGGWGIALVFVSFGYAVFFALTGAWAARRLLFDWRIRLVVISALAFAGGVVLLIGGAVTGLSNTVHKWEEVLLTGVTVAYAVISIVVCGWWFLRGRRNREPDGRPPGDAGPWMPGAGPAG